MSNLSLPDERELLQQVATGDGEAYTIIFRHYSKQVFDVAMLYLKDDSLAREIVQEIFMKIWLKRAEMSGVKNFKDYLFILTRNHIYDGFKKQLYEQGINMSMSQWKVSSPTYINDNKSVPDKYTDPRDSTNNAPSPTTTTIRWDETAADNIKLERIITQKWIAMFPEGQEAWTEFRRTGYPKLFPEVHNNSSGTITTAIQIRKLPFPQNEYTTNPATVADAVKLLGGLDNGGTRVWWDKQP